MLMRMVCIDDWDLSGLPDLERRQRLLNPPRASDLVARLLEEALQAAASGQMPLERQEACEARGYFRLVAQVPVAKCTFDYLFNGRSGYRAQYYLSPEEGILYNRQIVDGLVPAVRTAYDRKPLHAPFEWVERSLRAPHAKIWVFQEREAFDTASKETLNPPRWVEHGDTRGRRVPLLDHPIVDLKGAFIRPGTDDLFVDPLKLERPCDLHRKGFT
jgi:hypothetical protein